MVSKKPSVVPSCGRGGLNSQRTSVFSLGVSPFLILTICDLGCSRVSATDDPAMSTAAADAAQSAEPRSEQSGATSGRDASGGEVVASAPEATPDQKTGTGAATGMEASDTPPNTLPAKGTRLDTGVTMTLEPAAADAGAETEALLGPVSELEPVEVDAGVSTEPLTESAVDPLQPIVDHGGTLSWVVSAAGDGHDRSEDIAAFEDGSVVVTGLFGNSKPNIVFGKGEPNETSLTANHSVGDMFIARFNADGSLAFALNHNLTYPNTRRAIVPLSDGSFVISASYWGGTIFGQGEVNQVETPTEEAGVFIAKHNADGTLSWVTRVTGAGMPAIVAVSDGFVVTGPFSETAVFDLGGENETVLELIPKETPPATEAEDAMAALEDDKNHFIAKFTSDGALAWVKRTGGSYWNAYRDIAALPDDSVVLTGTMDDIAVFGAGEAGEIALVSEGGNDVFVAKYHPDGSVAWATRAGGAGYDGGISLSCLEDESVVLVGHYGGPAVFGLGEANETTLAESAGRTFMAKYNPDSTLAFARALSGAEVVRAASLKNGTTLITGTFSETATFGAGEPNEITLTATERDIFIAKYVPDGRLAWVKQVEGPDIWNEGRGIALTSDAVFIAGFFSEHATFAPGEPEETTIQDHGMDDMFVAKYEL